jgi:hypothetical protein
MEKAMSAPISMPPIGTKAVHKDDHAKKGGPVWEVYDHFPKQQQVGLKPAKHKLNVGKDIAPKAVPLKEFNDDYKLL